MEQSWDIVNAQNEHVRNTSEKFNGISEAIECVLRTAESLNDAGLKMSDKQSQVIDSISNLTALSEENAAGSREAMIAVKNQTESIANLSRVSHEVAVMAEQIMERLSLFKY